MNFSIAIVMKFNKIAWRRDRGREGGREGGSEWVSDKASYIEASLLITMILLQILILMYSAHGWQQRMNNFILIIGSHIFVYKFSCNQGRFNLKRVKFRIGFSFEIFMNKIIAYYIEKKIFGLLITRYDFSYLLDASSCFWF